MYKIEENKSLKFLCTLYGLKLMRFHSTGSVPCDRAWWKGSAYAQTTSERVSAIHYIYQDSARGDDYNLTRFGSPEPGLKKPLKNFCIFCPM